MPVEWQNVKDFEKKTTFYIMKNLFKYLLLFLTLLNIQTLQSQTIEPVTVSTDGVVTLKGKGKLGGNKDGAQWRRYKFARTGNFYISGYFRSLTNSSTSFTGLAFRNIPSTRAIDGGNATIGLFVENDTLKAKLKLNDNTRFVDVAVMPNVKLPVRLKLEKNNNSVKFYFSKDAESSLTPVYTLMSSVANAFTGWNDITQNFATGSKLTAAQTAVVSNINFGSVAADGTPSCTNGSSFDVLSVTKTTGTLYNVQFNGANLSSVNINISNSSNTSVRNYTTNVTANPLSIDVGSQSDGGYTLTLTGQSCVGVATKNFTIGSPTSSPAPTIASSPATPTAGNAVTFTASGCSGGLNWYRVRGDNTLGPLGTNAILSISSPVAADSYFANCTIGTVVSVPSNYIEVLEPVVTGGGTLAFTNILKTIPVENQTDRYNVAAFGTIGTKLKNIANGRQKAIFPVIWHTKLTNFVAANKKTWDLGISSPVDIVPNLFGQEGDGVRCLDYIMYANPNTGLPYANGIDTDCNLNINTFISRRPFQFRVKGEGGTLESMNGWSLERYYDEGVKYTNGDKFGFGDVVGGKSNIAFNVTDVENGAHGRFEEIPIAIGMANTTFGDVVSMYNQCITITFPDLSHYPLNYITGGYVANRIKLDGTIALDGNGNLQQNNVINDAWKPENKVSIPSRGISNKGLIDFENVKESSEVSCLSSAAFHQGELINYDNDNKSLTRVTNKFGLNRNAEHIVAHTKYATEVRKWHLRKSFNDRDFFTLTKDLCDRLNVGLTNYGKFGSYVDNEDLRAMHLPRDLAFINSMVTAFNGSYIYEWDRNTAGKIIDGKNGKLFAINLLNQRKNLSQGSLSFVDLFNSFDYKLWTAEISYDGGNTWKQEKGTDLIMNQTSITHLQCSTSNGIWAVFLGRPENTELKACKLRIQYGGSYKYLDITPNMWETTDPTYATTPLSSLPDAAKDYYYDLIDLTGGGPVVETTTPVAPSISSNINSPTTNQNVTLTSTGCSTGQINKWYTADEGNYLASGLTYSFSAVNGNSYFAKCTTTSLSSAASNTFTVTISTPPPTSGTITITEPNKTPYYFSNGHAPDYYANNINLPAVHKTSTRPDSDHGGKTLSGITMKSDYSMTNDLVWLQNDKIKVGINLLRGGQIAWISTLTSNKNLVYNGYDGGFQISCDIYQRPDGYTQNGKTSRFQHDPNSQIASYNTTMGGDFNNNSQSLIDYRKITNGYVVKFRPIFYTFDCEFSQVTIEVKYTLEPGASAVRCEYTYHSFRTDGQYTNNTFDSSALPACFVVNDLTRYQFYSGTSPWNYSPVEDGVVPTTNIGGRYAGSPAEPVKDAHATERWSLVYNPNSGRKETVGIYIPTSAPTEYTKIKQLEVYAQNGAPQGNEFNGGFTYFDFARDLASITNPIPDRSNFTKTMVAYIIATETENGMDGPANARKEAYRLKTLLGN